MSDNAILLKAKEKAIKLLEQFNQNVTVEDRYTSRINCLDFDPEYGVDELSETEHDISYPYEITILNHDDECALFTFDEPDEDNKTLKNFAINKCGNKSGTTIINHVKDFAKTNGYTNIELENSSALVYNAISKIPHSDEYQQKSFNFPLTVIKILHIGNSWYSRFGFNNENTLKYQEPIRELINILVTELLLIVKTNETQDYVMTNDNMKLYIKKKNKINEDEIQNTMHMSISDLVSTIMSYLKRHEDDELDGKNGILKSVLEDVLDFFYFLIDVIFSLIENSVLHNYYITKLSEQYSVLTFESRERGGNKSQKRQYKNISKKKKYNKKTKKYSHNTIDLSVYTRRHRRKQTKLKE